MKKTSEFASYARNQLKMNSMSKNKVRKQVASYYDSLHQSIGTENFIQQYFTSLFHAPMTFAKLATYVVATIALTTGVYAGVDPSSFARANGAVKAGFQSVIHTSLNKLNISTKANVKASNQVTTALDTDIVSLDTDAALATDLMLKANQTNTDSALVSNAGVKTDVDIKADVDAKPLVNAVTNVVDRTIDSSLKAVNDVDAKLDLRGDVNTNTDVIKSQIDASATTSVQGNVDTTTDTAQDQANKIIDQVKQVDPSVSVDNNTSSSVDAQGSTTQDSVNAVINSSTQSNTNIKTGL